MFTAGNTLEQSVAMVVAANDSIQNEEKVGNALKTISMRLRGAGKETLAESGIDTTGMATRKDLVKIMKNVAGVDLMSNANTFKSTYDILDEIAGKWQNLSDLQRAVIQEQAAGKAQGAVFASLMTNWEDARKAFETAQNAEGSAVRENKVFLQSIAGRKKQFAAAFETFSSNTLDSNMIKAGIQVGTKAMEGLNFVTSKTGGWGSLLLLALAGSAKNTFSRNVKGMTDYATSTLSQRLGAGLKGLGREGKSLIGGMTGFVGAHPVIAGAAALTAVTAGVGTYLYNTTYQDAEKTQESITNAVTAYKSAANQLEGLNKQKEELEGMLAEIESSDTSIAGQATAANYRRQIAGVENQIAYQQSLAGINQQTAAADTARAMSMTSYYDRNFRLANMWDNLLNATVGSVIGDKNVVLEGQGAYGKKLAAERGWQYDEGRDLLILPREEASN